MSWGSHQTQLGSPLGRCRLLKGGFVGIYWIICGGTLCCTAVGQDRALLVEVKEAAAEPYDSALS